MYFFLGIETLPAIKHLVSVFKLYNHDEKNMKLPNIRHVFEQIVPIHPTLFALILHVDLPQEKLKVYLSSHSTWSWMCGNLDLSSTIDSLVFQLWVSESLHYKKKFHTTDHSILFHLNKLTMQEPTLQSFQWSLISIWLHRCLSKSWIIVLRL